MNAKLRYAVKIQGHSPADEAATKLIYLVLRDAAAGWKMPPCEWTQAKSQFAIMFEGRLVDPRIQQASHLLTITDEMIESITNAVSYDNPFAFSNVFPKIMGSRPSNFRNAAKARLTT